MADKKVIINPCYLTYDTPDVQRLLDEVSNGTLHVEQNLDPASLFDSDSSE